MTEVVKWLKLAEEWSNRHPDVISPDVGKSLAPLIQSFETGLGKERKTERKGNRKEKGGRKREGRAT